MCVYDTVALQDKQYNENKSMSAKFLKNMT